MDASQWLLRQHGCRQCFPLCTSGREEHLLTYALPHTIVLSISSRFQQDYQLSADVLMLRRSDPQSFQLCVQGHSPMGRA